MSSRDMKDLRKQLKNVIKELMPEILEQALAEEVYRKVTSAITTRLTVMETEVRSTLSALDQRSKDTLGYLVRQATTSALPNVEEAAKETVKPE